MTRYLLIVRYYLSVDAQDHWIRRSQISRQTQRKNAAVEGYVKVVMRPPRRRMNTSRATVIVGLLGLLSVNARI